MQVWLEGTAWRGRQREDVTVTEFHSLGPGTAISNFKLERLRLRKQWTHTYMWRMLSRSLKQ